MKIESIRVYAEVLEQGLDFKDYLEKCGFNGVIKNVYTKKVRGEISESDSLISRIRKCKDVDVLITAISDKKEYPLLMVEYSTAVPTDDHKMQRADVYYWSSIFSVPMIKIYPCKKGMNKNFGGGNKFTDEIEAVLTYRSGAVFYPIPWNTICGLDTLETKKNALSCIYYDENIKNVLSSILFNFENSSSFEDFFALQRESYQNFYSEIFEKYKDDSFNDLIVDSSRFSWLDSRKKLTSKINRFGHAMDPDRGILYFTNMLVGLNNCVTEIQVNRTSDFNARGGYKALFDALSRAKTLGDYVKNIIETKSNIFTDEDALYIFEHALNIENFKLFKKISEHNYIVEDDVLENFLMKSCSMTSKCIFFLSTELVLTDKNRNIICSVKWNEKPIQKYLYSLKTVNYEPLKIKELTIADAKEDIITFSSVELYKKINCELLAVSYPGAQGDRCILSGSGRKTLRDYIDIIAYKIDESKVTVFLEECKDLITKSPSDVKKLRNIISSNEKLEGLHKLAEKTCKISKIDDVKISVGAKFINDCPIVDVDYIFMFDIDNSVNDKTLIKYVVAVIDMNLVNFFKPLLNEDGKLVGSLEFDKFYIIA